MNHARAIGLRPKCPMSAYNASAPVNIRKADESTVTPEFNLVLEELQHKKFLDHVKDG